MSMIDPLPLVLGGLAAGFVFGFLLQKGGVTRYATIVGQFLFTDYTVLKVMLTAILVGSIGVYGLTAVGVLDHLLVKPALLLANASGGLIFGVGMASLGYCPGTGLAAAAEGSRHAMVGGLGMLFGAMLFAEVFPYLDKFLAIGDMGKATLATATGVSPWLFILGLGIIAGGAFMAIARWERSRRQLA